MEISEVVSYFLNSDTNILEVTFRTIDDSEEIIRTDSIDFSIADDYGFDLITEEFDFFSDEYDEEIDDSIPEKIELDEEELIVFLNEYYIINIDKLPKPEIY